jgi:hypothetical protein
MKRSPACLLAALALVSPQPPTRAEAPAQVQPSAGTVKEVRVSETYAPRSFGDYIDQGHDWLYRRMQYLIEDFDSWFAQDGVAPIVVPVSPLRIDFDGEILRNRGGLGLVSARNFYASLQVPNLEHRLKVFITDDDLKESPVGPAQKQNSVRLGLRLIPIPHLDVEAGVRTKIVPAAFGTARWAWDFGTGALRFYPFAKAYVETGSGLGISGGIAAEHWSGPWVFRSASYANWVRDTAATDWSQTLILGYARAVIQERRYDRLADGHDLACGLVLKLAASGDRDSRSSQYEVSMVLKRPLHGGWLFGYVGPMVRWDRIYAWHPDVGVWVGFDALFWRLANDSAELATTCR